MKMTIFYDFLINVQKFNTEETVNLLIAIGKQHWREKKISSVSSKIKVEKFSSKRVVR